MKITVPEDLELKFLEYAHPNTIQNIETCGILAGSLVRIVSNLFNNYLHLYFCRLTVSVISRI
jgi:hypothetical protein